MSKLSEVINNATNTVVVKPTKTVTTNIKLRLLRRAAYNAAKENLREEMINEGLPMVFAARKKEHDAKVAKERAAEEKKLAQKRAELEAEQEKLLAEMDKIITTAGLGTE